MSQVPEQRLFLFQYAGRWFVYAQIPIWFSPPGCTCGTANYVVNGEGFFLLGVLEWRKSLSALWKW